MDNSIACIGVIIAAKDAASTIGRAVRSALEQPQVQEVIVVDDGSSDTTAMAAQAAAAQDARLRLIILPRNRGPSAARNTAIAAAGAPILCVLDADDYMAPGRLAKLLAEPDDWDFLADDLLFRRDGDDTYEDRLIGLAAGTRIDLDVASFVDGNLSRPDRRGRELGFIKPLMRRAFLERHQIVYDEAVRLGEDYGLYAEALIKGARFRLAPACGYVAVEQTGSLSRHHATADIAALLQVDDRLIAMTSQAPARAALRRHRRQTALNLSFRQLLDAKRSRRWVAALAAFLNTPQTPFYILAQVARAKLAGGRS